MRVLTLAQLTLVELWRQRTQWGFILLGAILALPALLPLDGIKVNGARPVGIALAEPFLAFAQFVAVFLAISAASGLVAHDLDRGTGLILLSKPLRREQILLGKLAGAGTFLGIAWIAWGLIAATAFSLRLGADVFVPVFVGFVASMLASWLLAAFCLLLSCVLPSSSAMGLGVVGWIVAGAAARAADPVAEAGYTLAGRLLRGLGELLPDGKLSVAARGLVSGHPPDPTVLASALLIAVWWIAAAIVFARRDLAVS